MPLPLVSTSTCPRCLAPVAGPVCTRWRHPGRRPRRGASGVIEPVVVTFDTPLVPEEVELVR